MKRMKSTRAAAVIMSLAMLFTMIPMFTAAAYADDDVEVIKTSEWQEGEPIRIDEDRIIEIDADITVPIILIGYNQLNSEHSLTIKGDGIHKLRIVTDNNDYNQLYSIIAKDLTIEKGSIVEIEQSEGMGYLKVLNEFTMNGGILTVKNIRNNTAPCEVKRATFNGGTVELTEIAGVIAFSTDYLTMKAGNLKACAKRGIFVGKKAWISGGMVETKGTHQEGILIRDNDDGAAEFIMTGGALLASCRDEPAFRLDYCVEPSVDDRIRITDPDGAKLTTYIDSDSKQCYTVLDKNGNPATTVNFKTSFENAAANVSPTAFTYDGKKKTPSITVKDGKTLLTEGSNYTVSYPAGCVNVGTYSGEITGAGIYANDNVIPFTFKINKANNPLNVKGKLAAVKYSKLKKKNQTLKVSKVLKTLKKGQGTVTYTKSKGSKKINIDKKTGKVTVKKGLKKGTYTVKVKVKAAGTKNYKALTKTVSFKIKVK